MNINYIHIHRLGYYLDNHIHVQHDCVTLVSQEHFTNIKLTYIIRMGVYCGLSLLHSSMYLLVEFKFRHSLVFIQFFFSSNGKGIYGELGHTVNTSCASCGIVWKNYFNNIFNKSTTYSELLFVFKSG